MPAQTVIQIRRGSREDWNSINPILAVGEIGLELQTNNIKIGDGERAWQDLPFSPEAFGNFYGVKYEPSTGRLLVEVDDDPTRTVVLPYSSNRGPKVPSEYAGFTFSQVPLKFTWNLANPSHLILEQGK